MEQAKANDVTYATIDRDYKALQSKGADLQNKLMEVMQQQNVFTHLRMDTDLRIIHFKLWGERLEIKIETEFNLSSRLVSGYLTPYVIESSIPPAETELFSLKFDVIGNIEGSYSINDFLLPFLNRLLTHFIHYISNRQTRSPRLKIVG